MNTKIRQWRWRSGLLPAGAAIALLAACTQLTPLVAPPAPVPGAGAQAGGPVNAAARAAISTAAAQDPSTSSAQANGQASATATPALPASVGRLVAARRGPIADTILLNGRTSGSQEMSLAFPLRGVVDSVPVQPGQAVQAGDLLMSIDTRQATKDLAAEGVRVDAAQKRLDQARAAAQTRQAAAVTDAQDRVRQAQDNLDKVNAGATASERRAAEAAVGAAQMVLDKAKTDLERAKVQPNPNGARAQETRLAEQKVTTAQVSVHKAEEDLAKLKAGPDPDQVRSAERQLAAAQLGVRVTQADLDRLQKGPDDAALRKAQRDVDRAQVALTAAQAAPTESRDAAVATARLNLDDAKDRLAALQEPPKPEILATQKDKVAQAQYELQVAQDRLNTVKKGPDPVEVERATATLSSAQLDFQAAQDDLARIKNSPLEADPVAVAQAAADAAELALETAQERQNELLSHPTRSELQDARSRLTAAQNALQAVRGQDVGAEVQQIQETLDEEKVQAQALQKTIDDSRMLAPQAGMVAYVRARAGDTVEANSTVVTLANTGEPIVLAPLVDKASAARLAAGQQALVQLDGPGSPQLGATVLGIADSPTSLGTNVLQVKVDWGDTQPSYGSAAQVNVTVNQKADVLLVPSRAVHLAGQRHYVEVMDNGQRTTATVDVGITGPTDTEILGGLSEGQQVVVPAVS